MSWAEGQKVMRSLIRENRVLRAQVKWRASILSNSQWSTLHCLRRLQSWRLVHTLRGIHAPLLLTLKSVSGAGWPTEISSHQKVLMKVQPQLLTFSEEFALFLHEVLRPLNHLVNVLMMFVHGGVDDRRGS